MIIYKAQEKKLKRLVLDLIFCLIGLPFYFLYKNKNETHLFLPYFIAVCIGLLIMNSYKEYYFNKEIKKKLILILFFLFWIIIYNEVTKLNNFFFFYY